VSHVGASLYDPVEFFEMQSLKALDTYQVPVNVFDQRFLCEEVTSCSAGKNLFARSIFLQGLLTLSEEDAEKKVRGSGHFISQLAQLSVQYSIPVRNMLVAYVKSFPFINSIVLGMETLEQVKQNVCLLADSSLPPNLFLEIQNRFSSMPSEIIDPRVWNNER
jgi:aryl-alcohol dehydrogenase-like predicted oxidoreductase